MIEKDGESSNADKTAFYICVAHLGGYLFFDATSQKVRPDDTTTVFTEEENFWIPLHVFGRLEVKNDSLDFLLLDDSWLQDELKLGHLRLTCTQDDEGYYLLTAPSKELKEFASRFATNPKAFSDKEPFERIPSEAAKRRSSRSMPLTHSKRSIDVGNRSLRHPSRRGDETQTILLSCEFAGGRNHDSRCDWIALCVRGTADAENIRGNREVLLRSVVDREFQKFAEQIATLLATG
ncbi:MAG TPA: hypothetical protein VJN92_20425 [Candidatus Acidoferrum sp.]|nr:hypothetical protein [Candidatus Acidoferrum sp.]